MDERDLTQALRLLSTRYPPMPHGEAIEANLLAAFDARERIQPRSLWMPAVSLAIAASIALIGFVRDFRTRTTPQAANDNVFIAIPYTIPPAPYERTTVVRMNIEVAALTAAGFEVRGIDAAPSVPADVLFAQDGRAVAIHMLNIPML